MLSAIVLTLSSCGAKIPNLSIDQNEHEFRLYPFDIKEPVKAGSKNEEPVD